MTQKPSLVVSTLLLVATMGASSPPEAATPEEIVRGDLATATDAYLAAAIELSTRHRDAGSYLPAQQLLEAALERASDSELELSWRARLLDQIGRTEIRQRQFEAAKTSLEASIDLASRAGDELARASALNALGGLLLMQADFELAEDQLDIVRGLHLEALEISERLLAGTLSADDLRQCRVNLAEAHFNLGLFDQRSGADQEAVDHYQTGLEAAELANDRISMAFCLRHLGEVAERDLRLEDAERFYSESLMARREAGNVTGAGFAYASLAGFLNDKRGQPARALDLLTQGLALMEASQDPVGTAVVLLRMARIHDARGELTEAGRYARRCLEAAEGTGLTFIQGPAREILDRAEREGG